MSEEITRARLFSHWALLPAPLRPPLGLLGERLARRYLVSAGWSILACNWRCPAGELDIVAAKENTLICVEVKSRTKATTRSFPPEDAINHNKRETIKKAARSFIKSFNSVLLRMRIRHIRFDVMGIRLNRTTAEINHYKGAFR